MATPKLIKAKVKAILSADKFQLQGGMEQGLPKIKQLHLIGIQGPRFAKNAEENEEEMGYAAREYLRERYLGKQVQFTIDVNINGLEFGTILFNGQDIAVGLLEEGLARLRENNKTRPNNFDQYQQSTEKAKKSKKGLFMEGSQLTNSVRQFKKDQDYKALFDSLKNSPVDAIVEDIQGAYLTAYLPKQQCFVKTSFTNLQMPTISYEHVTHLRFFLEGYLLQKDVQIVLKKFEDSNNSFMSDFVLQGDQSNVDLKKQIVENGFGKLTQDAVVELDNTIYKSYKQAQDNASQKGLRIWKDRVPTKGSNTSKNIGSEFVGKVIEIHSGDSLTIDALNGKEVQRYFLANMRAPKLGNPRRQEQDKPYAYESKEFLRQQLIGKKVRVEVEYSKVIQTAVDEEVKKDQTLTFVSVFLGEENISETLLEKGLVNVQMSRADEESTKYIKQLKECEEKAKVAKKGLFNPIEKAAVRFNDKSLEKNPPKLKQYFSFLKDEKKLSGIIDLVLSGSRYKVRLTGQNAFIIVVLHGIKCLANDKNMKQNEIWSNKALQYARDNYLQRDVDIQLEACDNRGIFHANVLTKTKNCASGLVENGLAYCFTVGKNSGSRFQSEYNRLEEAAKNQKASIWGSNVKIETNEMSQNFKELNEKVDNLMVSEIISGNEIYVQNTKGKTLSIIEKTLEQFDETTEPSLKHPVKKGTPCLALFSEDNRWYRAKVERHIKGDKYLVFFTDYGNMDEVDIEEMKQIPAKVSNYDPQAQLISFAYVVAPGVDHDLGDNVAKYIRDQLWEKKLEAKFVYQSGNTKYCMLYFQGNNQPHQSINYNLLLKGYAKIDKRVTLDKELGSWLDEEETAIEKKIGLWKYGEIFSDEDDDY